MTRLESLLSNFFHPVPPSNAGGEPVTPSSQRCTHLVVPIEQDVDVDCAAEVSQILAHWIRLDLTFAVLWFSADDLGIVVLTPNEILLHRLGPATSIP